jgi:transcriptional regulator with XRE-family HTH domain
MLERMDDPHLGSALKSIRIRAGLPQAEVAVAADVPRSLVGRIEHGRMAGVRLDDLRSIAAALGASVDLGLRWQGGDLGRLINARHAAIHEAIANRFGELEGWALEPEVSFSSYGERGVIDGLAWHAATRSLLVLELKSEIVDINDLMGSVDRKRRLAADIGRGRGWTASSVSTWVVVADGRTNRRTLARHAKALRLKFPADGHAVAAWLRRPTQPINALGFLPIASLAITGSAVAGARHARHARTPPPEQSPNAR